MQCTLAILHHVVILYGQTVTLSQGIYRRFSKKIEVLPKGGIFLEQKFEICMFSK